MAEPDRENEIGRTRQGERDRGDGGWNMLGRNGWDGSQFRPRRKDRGTDQGAERENRPPVPEPFPCFGRREIGDGWETGEKALRDAAPFSRGRRARKGEADGVAMEQAAG